MLRLRSFAVRLLRSVRRNRSGTEFVPHIPENELVSEQERELRFEIEFGIQQYRARRILRRETMEKITPIINDMTVFDCWGMLGCPLSPTESAERQQRIQQAVNIILAEYRTAMDEIASGDPTI